MAEKIVIDLGFANLIAEASTNDYKEIYVALESKDGVWFQDLAVIGQKYHHDDNLNVVNEEGIRALVYADKDNEDYTNEFDIGIWKNEEENSEDPVIVSSDGEFDVDIAKISSCDSHSLDECENSCGKYSSCDTVAMANDLLRQKEDCNNVENKHSHDNPYDFRPFCDAIVNGNMSEEQEDEVLGIFAEEEVSDEDFTRKLRNYAEKWEEET